MFLLDREIDLEELYHDQSTFQLETVHFSTSNDTEELRVLGKSRKFANFVIVSDILDINN